MKKLVLLPVLIALACAPVQSSDPEVAAWEARADRVTIIRDDWGIPHIHGETDADAVFGLMYAQAEDDFNRIEVNFLNSQGRLAEAEGESEIYRDLRMRLFIDPNEMESLYEGSPPWLKELMYAWADGLNYYLHTHPEVEPRALTRFEPWMALTFSEGSIGGDIERVDLDELAAFYGSRPESMATRPAGAGPASERAMGSGRQGDRVSERAMGSGGQADPTSETGLRRASDSGFTPPGSGIAAVASEAEAAGSGREPRGSNGFAIAPSNTAGGNALLLINPHTSFYFRAEVHVASDEGLNAYGAVTWGQFFVYQGFNETAGWMHTSSGVDNIDEFLESVTEGPDGITYRYGGEDRPMESRRVTIRYATGGGMAEREFTVYRTHHGPVVREADGRWVSVGLMEEPRDALIQSYSRTRAANYAEFAETMRLYTNSSNNTVFADAEGNIAYFHSNFIPIRDESFDWSRPVDGTNPAADWQGVHTLEQTVGSLNPSNGWIQNTNNWPFSVSGATSPSPSDFPGYMQRGGENFRGVHAIRVLEGRTDFTMQGLIDAAYDSYLTGFDVVLPPLLAAWDALADGDARKAALADQVEALRAWDRRWDVTSVPTSLAIFWGDALMAGVRDQATSEGIDVYDFMARRASPDQLLDALAAASQRLEADFGSWQTPWGDINRFQRLTGDIVQPHDDDAPSIPVGFASGRWGSLASFGARRFNGSRKLYGTSGNSFVAAVEFGDRVRARAVTAGGLSSDPASPHFNDQALRYSTGDLRPVYFYPDELEGHIEREYRPGR